jgi:purine-binding chemotaxis protein CheW
MNTPTATLSNRAKAGKYLTFSLGHEYYGIEVLKVREIIRMLDITAVPQMPHYVKGVMNLRGKVIPVIDLRLKFQLERAETTERTCTVVVQIMHSSGTTTQMGIIVDGVEEVINITESEIEDTPNFGVSLPTHHFLGMAKIKGAVKTLLDIDHVIESESISHIQALTELPS